MKKLCSAALAAVLLFTAACGGSKEPAAATTATTVATTAATTVATTTATTTTEATTTATTTEVGTTSSSSASAESATTEATTTAATTTAPPTETTTTSAATTTAPPTESTTTSEVGTTSSSSAPAESATTEPEPEPSFVETELCYIPDTALIKSVSVDKTAATVYTSDTSVIYTVTTDEGVERLEFSLVALGTRDSATPYQFYRAVSNGHEHLREISTVVIDQGKLTSDYVTDPESGERYFAGRTLDDGRAVWTVGIDFGYTAVEHVRITAKGGSGEGTAILRLDIEYPTFNADTALEEAIDLWVKLNLDEPILYQIDYSTLSDYQRSVLDSLGWMYLDEQAIFYGNQKSRSEILASEDAPYLKYATLSNEDYYDLIFDASPIYRGWFTRYLGGVTISSAVLNSPTLAQQREILGIEDKLVSNDPQFNRTFIFNADGFTYELRAIIAYRGGYEIDPIKFPRAHSILAVASAALEEIIKDGMTDFEKEQAIYRYMMSLHNNGYKPLPENMDQQTSYDIVKTAYGLLGGYGGDCMGWSGTFFTLCNMAGIPCSMVDLSILIPDVETGGPDDNYSSSNHRINLIRLDGEYYLVEVFWFYQKNSDAEGDYRFMNMTSEYAAEFYRWPSAEHFGPIDCNGSTYLVDPVTGELLSR